MAKINVLNNEVRLYSVKEEDYISLTDIARYKDSKRTDYIIQNWLRNRNTIEFLGIWEHLNNPDFNPIEFDGIKKQAGLNSFILTAKRWIGLTSAIGIISKAGRYGGTYAHFIQQGLSQSERLQVLNDTAIQQMKLLTDDNTRKYLEGDK